MNLKTLLASLSLISAMTLLSNTAIAATNNTQATTNQPIVMGYWTDWSPYWQTRPYPVSGSLDSSGKPVSNPAFDLQMQNLNVLNYAFLEADNNGVVQFFDTWSDLSVADASFCQNNKEICQNQVPSYGLGNFTAFSQLNNKYPNLKRQISIGGYSHDATFINAFNNPSNFVNSIVAIVNNYKLDGVDLDFEPMNGWTPDNVKNFMDLAQKLRTALPNTTITMAATANQNLIQQFDSQNAGGNWKKLMSNVNYINVMAYDFHGGFDNVGSPTAFHSNLFSDPKEPYATHFSGDAAIQAYLQAGVTSQQLILGLPAYGRVVASVKDGGTSGLYQPFYATVSNGDLGGEMESYYSIMSQWLGKGYTDHFYSVGNNLSGIYAYSTNGQFVSYDNTALVDAKAKYVKQNNLAGLMIWELRADLSPADPNNASLIKHMHDGLISTAK